MKRESGYNTKQKENLLAYLIKNRDKHTTVQELTAFLSAEGTPMGTATIYRQLDKLVENGLVRKYVFNSKTGACYQYIGGGDSDCHEHFHLKCIACGQLIHLNCDHLLSINQHIFEHHGFTVDPSQTVFYGICNACSGAEEK